MRELLMKRASSLAMSLQCPRVVRLASRRWAQDRCTGLDDPTSKRHGAAERSGAEYGVNMGHVDLYTLKTPLAAQRDRLHAVLVLSTALLGIRPIGARAEATVRVVREPRAVLSEFGTNLRGCGGSGARQYRRLRYLVVPARPKVPTIGCASARVVDYARYHDRCDATVRVASPALSRGCTHAGRALRWATH